MLHQLMQVCKVLSPAINKNISVSKECEQYKRDDVYDETCELLVSVGCLSTSSSHNLKLSNFPQNEGFVALRVGACRGALLHRLCAAYVVTG